MRKPEQAVKCLVRFVLAQAAVSHGMELMTALFSIAQGMISSIMSASGLSAMATTTLPAEMVTVIEDVSFLESMDIKSMPFQSPFGARELTVTVCSYAQNKRLAVSLLCKEEGFWKPYAFLTVNLPKEPLQANEAFIKDFDENTGLLDFVLKNQLGTLCPERGRSGFCTYPKIAFDMEKLREFDPEGTEKYLHKLHQKKRTPKRKSCLDTKTFAIARLCNDEKTMGIHIHDCYEIYFSISGGEQFLIDNRVYEFQPGDIFFINQFESHYLSRVDQKSHERVVLSIHPEYLSRSSTPQTDLNYCFTHRDPAVGHRVRLTEKERRQFIYFINKLAEEQRFGQDVLDQAVFLEMMTFLTHIFMSRCAQGAELARQGAKPVPISHDPQIDEILSYINQHLTENLSISMLASHIYVSNSYLTKMFKDATGTTVNRYITAKRISKAKALLAEGHSVAETSNLCGFNDYSNFFKSFSKIVGISPKKYAACIRG